MRREPLHNLLAMSPGGAEVLFAATLARVNFQARLEPRTYSPAPRRDALQHCQAVAAGQSNILGCLRTAKYMVSPQCNAALDAAYVR
jgi:hypothetical protein